MLGVIDLSAAYTKAVLPFANLTNGNKTGVLMGGGGGVPANFQIGVGAGGGSGTVKVEESDDDVTYTPLLNYNGDQVSFALVAGDVSSATPFQNGNRSKPYVRAVVSNVSGTIPAQLTIVEGAPYASPAGYEAGAQTNYDAN
jgi:hypothetical protein